MTETSITPSSSCVLLRDVTWDVYEVLRDIPANRHVRMTYDNGELELMSPLFRHEVSSRRLAKLVSTLASGLGLPCLDAGTTTLKQIGQGKAKEADTCFYLANEPRMREKSTFDPATDPPPDLAIEVEITRRSEKSLPIYAALGVPEVWRFDGRTLWFGQLQPDGTYAECARSASLPILTRALVLDWLRRADEVGESPWLAQLHAWVRDELAPRDEEGR